MQKLTLIIEKINQVDESNKFIKQAKKAKIQAYSKAIDKVNEIDIEIIKNHNFESEVLGLSIFLEKQDFFKKHLEKKIEKLERHLYSPEQNKLHFTNGKTLNASQQTSIESAKNYIVQAYSLNQLENLIK